MSNKLLYKIGVSLRYLWQHGLEALSERFYLFNTQADIVSAKSQAPAPEADGRVMQFKLLPTESAQAEFGIVERKLARMEKPAWTAQENCACLICGGPIRQVVELTDASEEVRLALGWCPACDYLQYSRRPPTEWFADWYKNSFDSSADLEHNLEVRPFTRRYYKRLQPLFGNRKLKVLDLGAGYGEKTMAFQREGHQLFCIEPSQARADYLKSAGCEVICGVLGDPSVEAFMRTHGPFDMVFTYHVVEHVAGSIDIFEQLASHVVQGGYFYLAIPELYKEGAMNNIFTLEHLNNFSRTAAMRFLNRLGFSVQQHGDDRFQYYTNYCQYLVGRKVGEQPVAWEAANADAHRFPAYLYHQMRLDALANKAGTVRLAVFGHQPLDYAYSGFGGAAVEGPQGTFRIRFSHGQQPLFWAS